MAFHPPGDLVTRASVPLASLPPALAGLTILVVSDTHIASRRSRALRALNALEDLRPDLLVACGDLIDRAELAPLVARRLADVRATHGAVAVWGNHDLFGLPGNRDPSWVMRPIASLAFLRQALEHEGVQVLDNSATQVSIGAQPLQVIGLGDSARGIVDVPGAYERAEPDLPTLVVAHNPDAAYALGDRRADLIVCGHTHGGQIVLPFLPVLRSGVRHALPRARGLMHVHGRPLFISAGIGTVGLPFRFNAPAEAPLLTLIRPDR